MTSEVKGQLESLEKMIQSGDLDILGFHNFFDEWDWEDDYSHNEISEFQYEFREEAEAYLKENHKGKYLIHSSIVITRKHFERFITIKSNWVLC